MKQIKSFSDIVKLSRKGCFDVKVYLSNGLFSRKTVFDVYGVLNCIDESEENFKNKKESKAYWDKYLKNFPVVFDGYN